MPSHRLLRSVARLATLLEPTRRRLFDYINEQDGPVSRDTAASELGMSRAMAAFHLDRLVDSGLLRAGYRRLAQGRRGRGTGRPSKLYRRSRRRIEVTLPPRSYELLARILAETVDKEGGGPTPHESGHAIGRSLGVRARAKLRAGVSPVRMTNCVTDTLTRLGFEPVPARGALIDLRSRNCPFDPISRQLPDVVCQAAIGTVAGVIDGVAADHLVVRRDPQPGLCCVVVATAETASGAVQ